MATQRPNGRAHRFGGDWTERKLSILGKYLNAYTKALRNTPFEKEYIDAFAGTGYRDPRRLIESEEGARQLSFPLSEEEPQALLDGSARIALKSVPPFDRYFFIERSAERCTALEQLCEEFKDKASSIEIIQGDANLQIQRLCARPWGTRRAVLFLDPYGMQVEWGTIEAIAQTRAIDLWLLFPLGIGVNRLLPRNHERLDDERLRGWRERLDLLLGTTEWFEEFYPMARTPTLFGEDEQRLKASTEIIGGYFNRRLGTVFAGVAPRPAVLRNSSNNPLYLLCFAVGNERGKDIALRIANHLLKGA